MKRFTSAAVLTTLLAASAAVATAVPAAAGQSGQAGQATAQRAAVSSAEQQDVVKYWTKDRMRNAIPIESKYSLKLSKSQAQALKKKPMAGSAATQQTPQPRMGKVFFTLGGADYVCSGTATNSTNGSVVTTAGHCVNEGPGAYATKFAFVPAYLNGNAPYGTWTARALVTTNAWKNSGDFNYDVGFAIMNTNGGKTLTGAVGGYPIAFNQARGGTYTAYGYPAASPFNGQTFWSCQGTVMNDTYGGSNDQGLPCNMTGGSSGGGWIKNGNLNSVNSFGYTAIRDVMWGPYFGSTIQSTYTTAANS